MIHGGVSPYRGFNFSRNSPMFSSGLLPPFFFFFFLSHFVNTSVTGICMPMINCVRRDSQIDGNIIIFYMRLQTDTTSDRIYVTKATTSASKSQSKPRYLLDRDPSEESFTLLRPSQSTQSRSICCGGILESTNKSTQTRVFLFRK